MFSISSFLCPASLKHLTYLIVINLLDMDRLFVTGLKSEYRAVLVSRFRLEYTNTIFTERVISIC